MSGQAASPPLPSSVPWHDAECGGYSADLPVWERLAGEAGGTVLDLGTGTGRVALHLAAHGHEVVAADVDAELLEALSERAAERSLGVATVVADVRDLKLGRDFELILAPMQLAHLLGDREERSRAWSALAAHLVPGGTLALAILQEPLPPSGRPEPIPDVREVAGWVHSSLPMDIRVGEAAVEIDRLRQLVAPDGTLTEILETTRLHRLTIRSLATELAAAGLEIRATERIDETAEHVGSLLVRIGHTDG